MKLEDRSHHRYSLYGSTMIGLRLRTVGTKIYSEHRATKTYIFAEFCTVMRSSKAKSEMWKPTRLVRTSSSSSVVVEVDGLINGRLRRPEIAVWRNP